MISPTDPLAARYTASANSVAGYAYSDNYLIDLKHAVIMDVEATTTVRQAEVGAAKTMLDPHVRNSSKSLRRCLVADAPVRYRIARRNLGHHYVTQMDLSRRNDFRCFAVCLKLACRPESFAFDS